MRAAIALSILAGFCCVARPAVAQNVGPVAPAARTDAVERVTVDFPANTFDRLLPFDVPFFITGIAPEGAVSLDLQYGLIPKDGSPAAPPRWLPATPFSWRPEKPTAANESFVVFIREPLDAERYYRFRFVFHREPSAEQLQKFRTLARPGFDARLRLVDPDNLPLADVQGIRQELIEIVQSIAGSDQWVPVPGSLFDTSDASARALVKVLEAVVPELGARADRDEILGVFVDLRLRLRDALRLIQSETALSAVTAAATNLGDPGLTELLKLDADGLSLPVTGALQLDLIAAGGVMGDLREVWAPDEVRTRSANYQQTTQRLQRLAHFISLVSDPNGSARPLLEPVVGAAALSQVAALVSPTGPVTMAIQHAMRLTLEMARLERALTRREQGLTRLTDTIAVLLRDERFVVGSTVADGATTQKNYVSADAGFLYAGSIGTAALYIGSNIYFRPVNKDAPLSQKGSFSRRFAINVGITLSSIADENNRTRTDLFANQSLVLGAGLRMTQSIRVGGGALVFRETNPNPLISKKTAAVTWYASFTFDLDVAKSLGGLGGQFQ
jgi:hypothetical protein